MWNVVGFKLIGNLSKDWNNALGSSNLLLMELGMLLAMFRPLYKPASSNVGLCCWLDRVPVQGLGKPQTLNHGR